MKFINKNIFFLVCLLLFHFLNVKGQIREHGLLAHFNFNKNVLDNAGNLVRKDTTSFDYSTSKRGKFDKAIQLNKNSNLVYFDPKNLLNPHVSKSLTFSLWIKLDENSGSFNQMILSHNANKKNKESGYFLYINEKGNPVFKMSNSKKDISEVNINQNIKDGKWHLIVASISNGKKIKLSVDNSLDTTLESSNEIINFSDSTLNIGMQSDKSEHFKGNIDNLRIYDLSLSSNDIFNIYTEDINLIGFEVDAIKENGAYDDCKLQIYVSPNEDKVLVNTGKYKKLQDFTLKIINKKAEIIETIKVDKGDYDFDLIKWGGRDIYFLEVFDKKGNLQQVYKLNLNN